MKNYIRRPDDKRLSKYKVPVFPITCIVLHENKSQGVLYQFTQGARTWTQRQKRYMAVGGELDGQWFTRWEISQSKYPTWYEQYNCSNSGQKHTAIWAHIKER